MIFFQQGFNVLKYIMGIILILLGAFMMIRWGYPSLGFSWGAIGLIGGFAVVIWGKEEW